MGRNMLVEDQEMYEFNTKRLIASQFWGVVCFELPKLPKMLKK